LRGNWRRTGRNDKAKTVNLSEWEGGPRRGRLRLSLLVCRKEGEANEPIGEKRYRRRKKG